MIWLVQVDVLAAMLSSACHVWYRDLGGFADAPAPALMTESVVHDHSMAHRPLSRHVTTPLSIRRPCAGVARGVVIVSRHEPGAGKVSTGVC